MSDMNESEAQSRRRAGESGEGESTALDCLEHFAFRQAPFADQPDPAVPFVPAGGQDPAVAVEAALEAPLEPGAEPPGRVITLTGPQGIGKSLTCRTVARRLGRGRSVALLDGLSPGDPMPLSAALCAGFRLPPSDTPDETVRTLRIFLEDRLARGRRGLVILDDAQALGLAGLDALAQMLALEYRGEPLLQAVLAGPDSLDLILDRPALQTLAQCVTANVQIGPFPVRQARSYIDHRITQARSEGVTFDPMTEEAKTRIARASGGVPGMINALCAGALDFAAQDGLPRVTTAEAEEVVAVLLPKAAAPPLRVTDEDVKSKPERSGHRGFGLVAASMLGLAAVGGGAGLLLKDTDALQRAQELVSQGVDSVREISNSLATDLAPYLASQDPAPQDPAPQDPAPQDPEPQDPEPQDPEPQNATEPASPASLITMLLNSVAPPPTGDKPPAEAAEELEMPVEGAARGGVAAEAGPATPTPTPTPTDADGAQLAPPDRPRLPPIESEDSRVTDALSRLDALREHMRREGQTVGPAASPSVDATEGADRARRISALLAERAALVDRPRSTNDTSTQEEAPTQEDTVPPPFGVAPPVGQQANSGVPAPDPNDRLDGENFDGGADSAVEDGAPASVPQPVVLQEPSPQAAPLQDEPLQPEPLQAAPPQEAPPQAAPVPSDSAMDAVIAALSAARRPSGAVDDAPLIAPSDPPVSDPSRPTENPGQPLWQRAGRPAADSAPAAMPADPEMGVDMGGDMEAGTTVAMPPALAAPAGLAGFPGATVAPVSAIIPPPPIKPTPPARFGGEASPVPVDAIGLPPMTPPVTSSPVMPVDTQPAAPVDPARAARARRQAEEDRSATAALNALSLEAARTGQSAPMAGPATDRTTAPRATPQTVPLY